MAESIHAVVLAGGSGTRFWPLSRASRPKQLLPLAGGPPLLAASVRRLAPLIAPERVLIATGRPLLEQTAEVVPEVPRENLLAEPAPRNTAPCIAWAAARVARLDPRAIVCVFPSDHHVADERAFREVLERAIHAAASDRLVTVGVVPTRAETGFGYVEVGAPIDGTAFEVTRFVEKPDRERAEGYLAANAESTRYLWNAGMFFFRAEVFLRAVEEHLPEVRAGLRALDEAHARGEEERALAEIFPRFPSVSIDYGVMEKARGIAVVPGDFGWSDLGSWHSAWELASKDSAGNVVPQGAVCVHASRNLISSTTSKVWALAHVEDLVIVETEDAVLVVPRDRAQEVRAIVDVLKARGGEHL